MAEADPYGLRNLDDDQLLSLAGEVFMEARNRERCVKELMHSEYISSKELQQMKIEAAKKAIAEARTVRLKELEEEATKELQEMLATGQLRLEDEADLIIEADLSAKIKIIDQVQAQLRFPNPTTFLLEIDNDEIVFGQGDNIVQAKVDRMKAERAINEIRQLLT